MRHCYLLFLLLLCQCTSATRDVEKYIVHSSGLYLGRTDNDAAALMPAEGAKTLSVIKKEDGSNVIASSENGNSFFLSLGVKDGWSTFFLPDSVTKRSRYVIEGVAGKYVKLRNLETGKYLGTDANDVNALVYSDKSGTDEKHLWFISDEKAILASQDTLSYMINALATRQSVEGWGVSLCWWARMCGEWSDEKIDTLVDWMVSPSGLNWNIFRYNIGGGDDPKNSNCEPHHMAKGKGLRAEMEGFQDRPNGPYHWERDKGQRKLMLKIKERRPDAIFEAFSNSAPWWMTYSGCCAGHKDPNRDNLRPEYYNAFAEYLVNVCKHYKDVYGIEFKTLEPFNEPVTNYWYANGSQEGCHFSAEEQVKFIRILHPILKASGLKTVLACSDETDTRQSVADLLYYKEQQAMGLVGQWNTHTYSATNRSRSQVGSLARSEGKTIWMDEVGAGGNGLMGNLNLCQKLFEDMLYILPSAWIDWQFVEENNDQWCLARADFSDEKTVRRVPNYYVRQQVTRFIKQGYTMVTSMSRKALAAINPSADTLVIALLNNSNKATVHQISIPGVKEKGTAEIYQTSGNEQMHKLAVSDILRDGDLRIALLPSSITTIIIPIEKLDVKQSKTTSEGLYMIVPQSNCEMALSVKDGVVCIDKANVREKCQLWSLAREGEKSMLKNKRGEILIDKGRGELAVSEEKAPSESRLFKVEPIEDFFHKITDAEGNAFALQDDYLLEGTAVKLYPYGTSVSADTKNWHLIRIE